MLNVQIFGVNDSNSTRAAQRFLKDQLFQWSAGRAFSQIASNIPVTGEIEWDVDITLADNLTANKGTALPAGKYIAQAFLVNHTDVGTRNPHAFSKKYSASVMFTITP